MGVLEVNRLFSRYVFERIRPKVDVFSQDWDNLLILDACRYDLFQEVGYFPNKLEWRWSDGSNSVEFIKYSVRNGPLDDVVWVTANPWVNGYEDSIFEVVPLWDEEWDEELGTVRAERVAERGLQALESYPNKRLVLHFMQPHYPFIGDGESSLPEYRSFTGDGIRTDNDNTPDIWTLLRKGKVEADELWNVYRENLEYVLETVASLLGDLDGKTVITSDHGNAFGTRCLPIPLKIYGHPGRLRSISLVKVPWIEVENDRRRLITSAEVGQGRQFDESQKDRLRNLGYYS